MNEQLKIIISAETEKLKQGIQEAKHAVGTFKGEIAKNKEVISKAWNTAGKACVEATKKMAVGAAAVGTALLGTVAATEEYRQNQAQLNAAFEQAGLTTRSAKDAYQELYRVIGDDDQAVESAANIAMLADSEQEAAKWAELASGVLGTFHDTLQPEAFYEAANETMKLGEATGAFTQMLEQTGVMSVDEFNKKLSECSTEAEKQAFMLEVSEKAMGDAGDAYDKATENIQKQRDAQAQLKDTLAKVGEAVSPLLTAFTSFANDALAAVTPYIQNLAETYGPQLADALERVGEALKPVVDFVVNHLGLIATIVGIIVAMATAYTLVSGALSIYTTVTTAWSAATTIATAVQTAFAAVNTAALAPILAVVAGIAAVIAIIVVCVKHWDTIKETVEKVAKVMWEKIKEAIDKIDKFFSDMRTNTQAKVEEIKSKVTEKFNEIKTNITNAVQSAKEAAVNKFQEIKTGIQEKVTATKTAVVSKFEEIKSGIKSKIDTVKTNVTSTFNAVKSAITKPVNEAKERVSEAVEAIKKKFKFTWKLPKPGIPRFSVSGGKAPWGFMGQGSLPKISIKWNKLGGIFDKPTLFNYAGTLQGIGEDGAEAVVPLEKNTQWLDRLAERLAAKQNGIPIVLQVDGKTFAQVSIDSINALTKQRGTLGLNLV